MTINAYAVHEAGGKLVPFEYDPGELAAHEVELEVLYCGVCHSDVSMIDNDWRMSRYPIVAGHEVVGKIIQTGLLVNHLKLGQIVGLGWHAGYCHHCAHCRAGDENLCANNQATIVGHYGGFADKVRADSAAVIPIPEGMDLESAGPLFCGGITVFNPLVQFAIKPTDQVAVIGIGGLGHLALQFLNAWGCEVTAFTSSNHKQQEALTFGAHHTLDSRDSKAIGAAANRFDLILSTANADLDWPLYLSTLSPRGRLHFVGITPAPVSIPIFSLISAQRSISGSPVGSPAVIEKMLQFAQLHHIKSHIELFPFERINDAIDHVRQGKARYRVVLERNK